MLADRRTAFQIDEWTVQPELNSLTKDGIERHIEPKVMKVLLTLAARQGHVVPKEELITAVWPDTFVSDDALTRCVSILRHVTEDNAHAPRFIQTIPKVGYRLVAEVAELPEPEPREQPALLPTPTIEPAATTIQAQGPTTPPEERRVQAKWAVAALAGCIIIGFIAVILYQRLRTTPSPAGSFRTVQFTSYAGEQIQPAFSPDGKKIAFVWIAEDGLSRHIYLKAIGSEEIRRLTTDNEEQFSPAWSPDGSQIAYLAQSKDSLGLYIANVASQTPLRRILIPQEPSHWEQGALSWDPSGKTLIYPDHSGIQPNSSLFRVDLETLHTTSITDPPSGWEGDLNPAFSPDGKWIAFTRASETAVRDVWYMSVSDGKVRQLTHDNTNIDSLTWTADSTSVIFSSNRGGKYGLWKIGLRSNKPERLPVGTEDAYQPATGPRPGQLAYAQGSAIWGIDRLQQNSDPRSVPKSETILTSTQQDSAPSLSPDGKLFAFQSHRSGNQEIWTASTHGDTLRQLTFMAGPLTGSPAWSNHGDSILFDSRPSGHSHIFVVPAAGGPPRQLTFGNVNDITPRWSHDDQTIYFRSNRGDRWQLWRVAASGGTPQPVTSGDGIVPQESPDGKWLYYTRGDEDGLWRVPPTGGAETEVLPQPLAGYWGYWQVTEHGIYYLDRTGSSNAIRIYDPETTKSVLFTTLKDAPPPYSGISVDGQGRNVLITDQRDADRHITFVEAQP